MKEAGLREGEKEDLQRARCRKEKERRERKRARACEVFQSLLAQSSHARLGAGCGAAKRPTLTFQLCPSPKPTDRNAAATHERLHDRERA